MNPLTNVKNINKLNEIELSTGSIHKKSWHDMYKGSAWIFIGGLEYGLTEGDVITVFSQYGEVVNINLVRDKKSGKSKGYCFICFANQKSTVLAVDNLNGIKLCNRTIRVDHVADYKPPKEDERDDEITKMLKSEGCAPKPTLLNESTVASNSNIEIKKKKSKKEKKKKKRKHDSDGNDDSDFPKVKVKKEKHDAGYDKYDTASGAHRAESRPGDASGHSRETPRPDRAERSRQDDDRRSKERSYGECRDKDSGRDDARSSSWEGSSAKYESRARRGKESKHSDSKRKGKYSSSSSSDSSSEDERSRTESRRDHQRKSGEESRPSHGHVHRREAGEFASGGSKHFDSRGKDYRYSSKDKYRTSDSHYRDSYLKHKYDKR